MPTQHPRGTSPTAVEPAAGRHPRAITTPAAAAPTAHPAADQAAQQAAYTVAHAINDLFDRGLLDNADQTRTCYHQRAGHLLRLLGHLPVASLHLDQVQQYAEDRVQEGAARETVRKELCVFRRSIDLAYRRGEPMPAPASLMPRWRVQYVPRKRWLDSAQAAALLAELRPARQRFVLTALYTGARLSELQRLEWEDIDWAGERIHVRGTKTSGSDRLVPLHPRLGSELKPWRRVRGPVLENWPNVRRDLAVACKAVGIPVVTPNDLRRTFASWLVQAGETSYVVAQLLGHSSSTMVERVYGRLAPKTLSDAVRKLP